MFCLLFAVISLLNGGIMKILLRGLFFLAARHSANKFAFCPRLMRQLSLSSIKFTYI
uniref:hypothetical protein n=1 Tax=Alistipes sp. TaxID=1872444 RepID=UPI004055A2D3